jgi:fibronectin-binding autotransporter adhesin
MTKKTINNFANEDALEGFNLQRLHLQVQGSEGHGRLSALSIENRHRISDTTPNYSKSNLQPPTSKIPNLLPLRRVWNIASPVLRLGKCVGLLAVMLGVVGNLNAQLYWNTNGVSGNWTDSNWGSLSTGPFSTAYTSGNNAFFTANSSVISRSTTAGNITVSSNVVVNFTYGSGSWGTGGTVRTLDVGTGGILDFGTMSSSGWSATAGTGFIKEGQGIVKLSGDAGWGGGFTLNNGTVIVGGVNAMGGAASNTLTINGGTLAANGNRDLTGKYGGGITVGGNFTIGGVTTGVSSGNGSATANILFSNNVSLGSSTRQITIGANGTYTFNGVISSTNSAGLTINATSGATGTLVLGGANTYNGTTTLNGGTLSLNSTNALQNSTLNTGAAGSQVVNFIVAGTNTYNLGGLAGEDNLSLGANSISVGSNNADTTYSAAISSTGGGLTKVGTGALTLSGANTYTGTTTINAGNLTISGGSAIADTGTVTLANAAGVGFNVNSSETIASLQGGGSTGGIVTIASGQTLTVAETGTQTFAGSLQGSGNFTKSGAGTLTLNGTNTNSGAVSVTGGTLAFSGANALSSSLSSLSATSSTISLSDGNGGNITISGGLSLNGATMIYDAGALDRLNFSGAATLIGTNTIQLANIGTIAAGNYTLLSAASGLGGSWSLNSAAAPSTFTYTLSNSSTTLSLSIVASANFSYWKGGNGDTWGTANNWTSDSAGNTLIAGAPGTTADVVFAATGATNLSTTLGADYTVKSLTINASGVTIAGANTLTANATSASAFNINASSGTTVISANLAGSGAGLTKSDAGTLTINGTNTFGGGLTLGAGTLNLNSAAAPGSGSITITGGTLDNTSGSSVTLSNNNAQNWNGDFTFTGTRDLNMGTGTVALGASRTVTVNGANLTVGGIISGTGYSLTKAGAGALTLGAANTYTGGTTLGAGTLNINNASAIGAGAFTITGGTLDNTSGSTVTLSTNNAQTWNGDFVFTGTSDLNLGNGAVTMAASRQVTVNGGNLTVGGIISGSGFGLAKAGAGTLILGGANTYTGATNILAGTLQTSAADRISDSSAISVSSGATFALGGNETVASLAGAGNYSLGANTLTFGDTSNQTVSGTISGTGALVKSGSGSITLSGSNSYSGGTTISSGTIRIGHDNALGSGNITSTTGSVTFASSDATARTLSNSYTSIGGSSVIVTFGEASGGTGDLTFAGAGSTSIGTGTRTFNVLNTTSLAGGIVGSGASGSIIKTGTGTLILYGSNTYQGATTINAGTFQVGNAGTSGALSTSSAITVNGTLAFKRSDTLTQGIQFSTAAIGGTGSVVQAGSGTLILNAANTYTGGTVLNTGTLRLSHSGAAGSGTITQSSGASLLHLNAAGTFANAMSVYNVQASENLTLSGGITVHNATFDVDNGDALTISGAVSGTGGVTKNGTGALILSGSNIYTGATTVNAGTLQAASANALGATANVTVNNGGSLLVTAGDSINNTAGITLAGGTLALNGAFNESVGALTLSANSTIDLLGFNGTLTFSGLGAWTNNATLAITNWNGINKYGTPVGSGVADRHVFFTDTTGLDDSNLSRISFYSGSFGVGFAGTAYELGGGEIGVVPEPETIVTAFVLLVGSGLLWLRRRVVSGKKAGCQPWRQLISFKLPPAMHKTTINGVAFPKDQVPRIIKAITKVDVFSQKPPRNLEPGLMRLIQEVVFGSPGAEEASKGLLKNLHKSPEALKYLALLLAQRSSD